MKVGDIYTWERTFTIEDVEKFASMTFDTAKHHVIPNEDGKLIVHGLLTASIGTKLSGEINFMGRKLITEYIRPVYTGDTIRCVVEIMKLIEKEKWLEVEMQMIYYNQYGKKVLVGSTVGIIND